MTKESKERELVNMQEKDLSIPSSQEASSEQEEPMIPVRKVLDLLEQHLGATSEIVYHDLTRPYEHTIVDIRHGYITGRSVNGCGSNLGLEIIRGTKHNGDEFNYITHAKTGRILRSSSIYICENGRVVKSICVNTDISDTLRFENALKNYNRYTTQERQEEHFAHNVEELLEIFFKEGQEIVGVPAPLMSRDDRMKFLKYLDSKGAFLISKSSEKVCDFLGISKYTLYNYLETVRSEGASGHKE